MSDGPAIPLARWAGRQLRQLAHDTGSARIAALTGQGVLAERAASNGFVIPGTISAGGRCHLLSAVDGWIALNLARPDDRELLPALFGETGFDPSDADEISDRISRASVHHLLRQGRLLGLAIASGGETPTTTAMSELATGPRRTASPLRPPLVVDFSALWAGPLAAHLLWLAGAHVVKVESQKRPDAMREGDPGLFALLNQGKSSVLADLATAEGRACVVGLLRRADIVIEAARPRALQQLGINADEIVRSQPGLTWITITGHGATGDAAEWVGFGDDCGVAGGLSANLAEASGTWGFVGDAIADPLTGIVAARAAWQGWQDGVSRRIGLSMSSIASMALTQERVIAPTLLDADLREWAAAQGQSISHEPTRQPEAVLPPLGADTSQWFHTPPC